MLATLLAATTGTMMAQEMNSAYFMDGFSYRHDMNPAYDNEYNYCAIPVLGNLNVGLRGSLSMENIFFKNPDYGKVAGAKKTALFLHPGISADQVLSGLNKGANTLLADIDIPILSIGFSGFNGYNTIELRSRTHVGASVPYEFFEFAKDMRNQDYSFDELGARGWSYMELGFGHSRRVFDNLRVGAKVKLLFGVAYADFTMDGVHANLQGDRWVIEGKAHGELNLKGATLKEKQEEYKSRYEADGVTPQKYNRVDKIDTDGGGLSGFGLGLDLGAVYEFKDCSVSWLNGLKASLALMDIGFISWSNKLVAESSGQPFYFDGFNNIAVKESAATGGSQTVSQQSDDYGDRMKDFANLQKVSEGGSATHGLAATLRMGLEYPLPVYDKLKFGFLFTHRYDDQYGWSEGRLSANYAPLKWLDGGLNLGFSSFSTEMGWMLNVHPKGFNFFVGMDYMIGKTGKSMIPLDSNVCFNIGFNVTWGKGNKDSRTLKSLTF